MYSLTDSLSFQSSIVPPSQLYINVNGHLFYHKEETYTIYYTLSDFFTKIITKINPNQLETSYISQKNLEIDREL